MRTTQTHPQSMKSDTPTHAPLSHIIVVTSDELESLADILDNPFLTLTEQQKALFVKGYRLVRI